MALRVEEVDDISSSRADHAKNHCLKRRAEKQVIIIMAALAASSLHNRRYNES
jgi:hypothetical protein